MDNVKIGKLIAELRKKKGLTQQDLGDMVGVGFKAVSKWECGTTLPDITIINEVSKILGITTDELLNGELNIEEPAEETKEKKKIPPKLVVTISIITVLLIFITTIFTYQSNKTYSYKIISTNPDEYYVDGIVYIKNDNAKVTINEVEFRNKNFNKIIIQNYEYTITANDEILFGYGYIDTINMLDKPESIKEFPKLFNVNFDTPATSLNKQIENNNIILKFKFLDNKNNEIEKEINLKFELLD